MQISSVIIQYFYFKVLIFNSVSTNSDSGQKHTNSRGDVINIILCKGRESTQHTQTHTVTDIKHRHVHYWQS